MLDESDTENAPECGRVIRIQEQSVWDSYGAV